MKKILVTCLMIWVLVLTACPKKSQIEKAASASYQFSGLIVDLVKATDRAHTEGLITTEQKNDAVKGLRLMNEGSAKFTALVKSLAESGEQPAPDKIQILNKILSDEVITPFLSVLTRFGAIDFEKAEFLRVTIAAIRIAILNIAGAFASVGQPIENISPIENFGRIAYV